MQACVCVADEAVRADATHAARLQCAYKSYTKLFHQRLFFTYDVYIFIIVRDIQYIKNSLVKPADVYIFV